MSATSPSSGLNLPPSPFGAGFLRRHSDLWLSFALGGMVSLLILILPMQAALATAVVGAFVLIMMVDTRVALFGLLLVRATIDVFATVPIFNVDGVTPNALVSLLTILLGAVHMAANRINIRRIPLATPFAIFVGVAFLGLATTPAKTDGLEDWLRIVSAFLIYILVVDLMRTERERRWLLRVIVLSSVVPLSVGLYQYATKTGFEATDEAGVLRILATFVHPSPYAFFLVQIAPLALLLFVHAESRIARLALATMLPVMAFSIYATQTRGAWIGFIVMVAVLMWFRAKWTLLFIPLFLAAVYVGSPDVRARIAEATTGTCESATYCESSVLWRTKQWERTIQLPNPVELVTVGAGLHSVNAVYGEFTHNEYLRLLVETGVLGLGATAVLYYSLFSITHRGFQRAKSPYQRDLMLAFMMTFFARIVMSGADNLLIITVLEWYFWAFAAVVVVESGAYDRLAHVQDDRHALQKAAPRTIVATEASPRVKVLLANKFFYDHGGPETVLFAERDLLRAAGHDVIDFAMADDRNHPSPYLAYFAPNMDLQSVRPTPSSLRTAWRFLDSGEAASRIRRLIRDTHPDIAHLHSINHQLTPSIIRVLRDEDVPVVMTLHDYKLVCPAYTLLAAGKICEKCSGGAFYRATTSNCRGRARSPLLTAESYIQHRLRRSYDSVALFLSPSRFLADKFREMGFKHPIEVLPNPLPSAISGEEQPRGDHVLFVGRAAPEKGLRTLGAAAIRSGVRVRIAGDGPQLDELKQDFGGVDWIDFLGRITPERARDEMRTARAVVVPSEWYENQPMVILEAFAQGTPVIASDLGGNAELVHEGETGRLFPAGDVAALAALLKQAISEPDEMGAFGARGREFVRGFLPQNHLVRLLEIYGRVLAASPARQPSAAAAVARESK